MTDKQKQSHITKNELLIQELQTIPMLTAKTVVDKARAADSPLHPFFEWDNTLAGEKYREYQARGLINYVKLTLVSGSTGSYESVRIKISEFESERIYQDTYTIMNDENMRRQVLAQAFSALQYWKAKYEQYSELAPIAKVISQTQKDLNIPDGE